MPKQCNSCKEVKGIGEFYKHYKMKDGHFNQCKICIINRVSKYLKTERGKAVDKRRNQKPRRKQLRIESTARMRKKHPKQAWARQEFWKYFKKGLITKLPCEDCGTNDLVEAHHPDYNQPLIVMWLCSLHHSKWHRENKAKNIKTPKPKTYTKPFETQHPHTESTPILLTVVSCRNTIGTVQKAKEADRQHSFIA